MRTAIVTGGSSGIGKATAVALSQAGYDVGITWHEDDEGAAEAVSEIEAEGRRAESRALDLASPEDGPGVIDDLIGALGGLDVLVSNAGAGHSDPVVDLSLEDWRRVLDINLTGSFLCGQAAARHMIDRGNGGRIINVTSVHEHVPLRESAAYCAAKGGIGLLTKVMALELAEHDITVNAVAPGEIATKMTGNQDVDAQREERGAIPLGRPGYAREIADWIVFLASPQSSYATGASFVVDGGLLLMAAIANQDS